MRAWVKPLVAVAATVLAVGGVAIAADDDTPVDFTLDCTLTDRTVECVGELPAATSTTVAPTTSSTTTTTLAATTTTRPTTTTSSSTTTSTTVAPPTTAPLPATAFSASFATPADFYDRFWTYTGNYCSFGFSCRPCAAGVGVCNYLGDHDMACQAPVTQRTVHPDVHNENHWWCAPNGPDTGHVMTAMNTSGYSISGFAPSRTFTGLRSICWDQNLTDLGGGKWFVVSIVPAAVVTSFPSGNVDPRSGLIREGEGPWRLDYTIPEFDADNGPGDFNLQRMQRMQFKLFRNTLSVFDRLGQFSQSDFLTFSTGGGFVAGTDVATRYRHCLTEQADGRAVLTQARPGGTASWNTGMRFPDVPVYVIFADDTYDADKHGGTGLYTWHIDNITIQES